MPKNVPSLKPRELLRILIAGGCSFLRHGKGDHDIYLRIVEGRKRMRENGALSLITSNYLMGDPQNGAKRL